MEQQRATFRDKWPAMRILAVIGFVGLSTHFHLTYGRSWASITLTALIGAWMMTGLIRGWRRLPRAVSDRSDAQPN